jgi:trehalose 6-phosphate phosphatase
VDAGRGTGAEYAGTSDLRLEVDDVSINPPILPPSPCCALLLDLDGTLLDFAPSPTQVVVPDDLLDSLQRLRDRLGGALGIITGRPIQDIDQLLGSIPTAVAGEHGAALRHDPAMPILHASLPRPDDAWVEAARMLVAAHPGAVLECKTNGFVLHFRKAPDAGAMFHAWLTELLQHHPASPFQILAASMAWELKAVGVHKGTALHALMQQPPFLGRLPVFVGDDVTDKDAIEAAQHMGGVGLLVETVFGAPTHVRQWLQNLAAHPDW